MLAHGKIKMWYVLLTCKNRPGVSAAGEHDEEAGGGAQVQSDLHAQIRPAPARPEAIVLLRLCVLMLVPHHPANSTAQMGVQPLGSRRDCESRYILAREIKAHHVTTCGWLGRHQCVFI